MRMLARVLAAAVAVLGSAQSAELSLPNVAGAPASSQVIPVSFSAKSGLITGFQFDLLYDSPALDLSATVGEAARSSGKSLYHFEVAPGQRRFLLLGLNRNPLADGAAINLFASIRPEAAGGAHALKIANAAAAGQDGEAIQLSAVDGVISVEGAAGSGPRLRPEGVLNGASLLAGPVAPGGIISLLGAGIGPASAQVPEGSPAGAALGGTSVLFDGIPAPLLYAAPNHINAVAPYGIRNRASTRVQVTGEGGKAVAETEVPVAEASPAIFTLDGSGTGAGAILNQDVTVNSPALPAEKGATIILYATGAGETDPAGADGQVPGATLPRPLLPVSVEIGGLDAKVLYAGAAPGMVAGALQVNCTVPPDAPSGGAVPIFLIVGGFRSPAGVTVAIQ